MRKVVLVGTGAVGTAYAYSMVNQGFVNELILIDANKDKAEGEAMDLVHGMAFATTNMDVRVGEYSECKDADMVVITAGANQRVGETRLQLVEKNVKIINSIVDEVVASGFNGIILMATNPVDVLTHVALKRSGFPAHKVIGSGTTLDTARFKVMLGEYFNIDSRNVHALILGEHGDSELPVWSQASIGTENLENFLNRRNNPEDQANLDKIFENVKNSAYAMISRKGFTNYGIGMSLTRITKAVLNNERSILPISTLLNGEYGVEDVCISVPVIIGSEGVKEIIELDLSDTEKELFKKSAEIVKSTFVQ